MSKIFFARLIVAVIVILIVLLPTGVIFIGVAIYENIQLATFKSQFEGMTDYSSHSQENKMIVVKKLISLRDTSVQCFSQAEALKTGRAKEVIMSAELTNKANEFAEKFYEAGVIACKFGYENEVRATGWGY